MHLHRNVAGTNWIPECAQGGRTDQTKMIKCKANGIDRSTGQIGLYVKTARVRAQQSLGQQRYQQRIGS